VVVQISEAARGEEDTTHEADRAHDPAPVYDERCT
jgi:hypothetical protein